MATGSAKTPAAPRVRFDARRGTWCCQLYLGKLPDGRSARPYRSFPQAASREEAEELAAAWAAEVTRGGRVASMRLVDLLEDYIAAQAAAGAANASVKTYRLHARYCRRFLGSARADELTALDFDRLLRTLLERGGQRGQGLSPSTVRGTYNLLRGAYDWLARTDVVEGNPLDAVERPGGGRRETRALDECDAGALAAHVLRELRDRATPPRARRDALAVWLGLVAGLRVGEACALRRRDVLARHGRVRVEGTVERWPHLRRKATPKTQASRRNVALAPEQMATLEAWMAWQRERVGPCSPDTPLVSHDGSLADPDDISAAFRRMARELGLPKWASFHTLRHTHASLALANGVDLKTTQERLGHSSGATTLEAYGHVLPGRDAAAAATFEALVEELSGTANGLQTPPAAEGAAAAEKPQTSGPCGGEAARPARDKK